MMWRSFGVCAAALIFSAQAEAYCNSFTGPQPEGVEQLTIALIDSGIRRGAFAPHLISPHGYNFGDCKPSATPACMPGTTTSPDDMLGHGTAVARVLVASLLRQRESLAGLQMLILKINPGTMDDFEPAALASAIDHARMHGAKLINLSIDMPEATPDGRQMVVSSLDRAARAGVIVVAAAGNRRARVTLPGSHPGVIAVAGSERNGGIFSASSFGPEIVIAAPAYSDDASVRARGTSIAAPHVTAAIALMLEVNSQLSTDQVKAILKASADPGALNFGILNPERAVRMTGECRR